jgi:hypothetical protein
MKRLNNTRPLALIGASMVDEFRKLAMTGRAQNALSAPYVSGQNGGSVRRMPRMYKFTITMVRNLVLVTALCLCGMSSVSAAPLTLEECKAKYKAAMATGNSPPGHSWAGFQEKICGIAPPQRRPKSSHLGTS